MRDTIAEIMDKYGSVKLHYLAIVFGNQAQAVITVRNQDKDPKTLISYINGISFGFRSIGRVALRKLTVIDSSFSLYQYRLYIEAVSVFRRC